MITIDAEFYPKEIIGYRTFEESVNAGIGAPVAARSRADSKLIEGRQIVAACWGEDSVALLLSGGCSLHIFVSGDSPEWAVGDAEAYASLRDRVPSSPECYLINYVTVGGASEGMDGRRFTPREMVQKCLGKEVLRIVLDVTALYLQFRGTGGWHVFFMPVKRHDSGEPFLVWVEDRD
jgi:hypothetical protein